MAVHKFSKNILLITCLFLYMFAFIHSKDSNTSSIPNTLKCLATESNKSNNDLTMYIDKCLPFFDKCRDTCISYMDTFNTCSDACRKIENDVNEQPTEQLNWDCYESCIQTSPDENFRNLIECISDPCEQQFKKSSSKWYVTVFSIMVIIIVIAFGLILYRYIRKEKIVSSTEITLNTFKSSTAL